MATLFRIGAASLVCLMPLALYLLFLASVNQRRRPTVLSGRWDYTCLLLGLSGFIVIGGALLVGLVDSEWRHICYTGNFAEIKKAWSVNNRIWSLTAGAYLSALAILIAASMYSRSKITVVYNIDGEVLRGVVRSVLESRDFAWRSIPGGYHIDGPRAKIPVIDGETVSAHSGILHIQTFPLMQNASLVWRQADSALRQHLEEAISNGLESHEAADNPASGWFMSAAVTIFVVMLIWVTFLIWVILYRPRGF